MNLQIEFLHTFTNNSKHMLRDVKLVNENVVMLTEQKKKNIPLYEIVSTYVVSENPNLERYFVRGGSDDTGGQVLTRL